MYITAVSIATVFFGLALAFILGVVIRGKK